MLGSSIADVLTFGGYYKEIHVEVDPLRLESFDLTLDEVMLSTFAVFTQVLDNLKK